MGSRLGPYDIVAPLGSGGMGEVYRALDTRLGRYVAVKVLPAALATDPDRLARLEREARTLASLNHPNLATVHGLERSGDIPALVMELVEGPTLAELLSSGALPMDHAVSTARQIADGLDAAHAAGVVHRDLKPANIKVRPDGTVKVLDFGLAKAVAPTGVESVSSPGASASPTITTPAMTHAGVILGTAAYMSPEQARGRAVDRRTDIWAFGCVLYEMLTGVRVFPGEDVAVTIAAVITQEPGWSALPAGTPASIRRLLLRCLQKEPRRRLADIADARLELDEAATTPDSGTLTPSPSLQRALWVGSPALIAVGLAAGWAASTWTAGPPIDRPSLRFTVSLGPFASAGALSPDGRGLLVRGGDDPSDDSVELRSFDGGASRPLEDIEGDAFFSPDGEWIGFQRDNALWKMSLEGGAPVRLCAIVNMRGASWGSDGNIVLAPDRLGGLSRCSAATGTLEPLTQPAPGEYSHRWPQSLAEAGMVLYTSTGTPTAREPDTNSIVLQSVRTGERAVVWKGGTYGRYLTSGHLVFVSKGTLFAAPLDLTRMRLVETPRPIVKGVFTSPNSDAARYDIAATGTFMYASQLPFLDFSIRAFGEDGLRTLIPFEGRIEGARVARDGARIAFTASGQGLWLYDTRRETRTRLAADASGTQPEWSRSGEYLFFKARNERRDSIMVIAADGGGDAVSLLDQRPPLGDVAAAPDEAHLAYDEADPATGRDIWVMPIDSRATPPRRTGDPAVFLRTDADEFDPRFSPDGRWMSYTSDDSGRREVYVRPYPGPGGRWPISRDGGEGAVWTSDGKELVYQSAQGQVSAVAYTIEGASFIPGASRVIGRPPGRFIDVMPDGRRILIIGPGTAAPRPFEVTFIVNFFDELRRQFSGGR